MDDETDRLSNRCTDLVSLRRLEPGLEVLLRDTPAGGWVGVRDLYAVADPSAEVPDGLRAAWLPAPWGDPGYVVVVFHDDETRWSLTAEYHAARLLRSAAATTAAAS